MLKIDFGMAQDSGQSKRPLIETPSKIFYFILNRLGFFLPCFLLCASVFCMIFFEREEKNPNRRQKSINQRNIATDVLYKMHTDTYNQSAFDAFFPKNQCAYIRSFALTEWQSIAQNLLIYFILLVVQVFDFCLFSSIFSVFACLAFVPAHKYINGPNNSSEWYALYVSLHSVHFFHCLMLNSEHTLALCQTHAPQPNSTYFGNHIFQSWCPFHLYRILLMSDICMNIVIFWWAASIFDFLCFFFRRPSSIL